MNGSTPIWISVFMPSLPRNLFCEFSTFIFPPLRANHEIWLEGSFGDFFFFFSNTLTLIVENDFKEWLIPCGGWWHKSASVCLMQVLLKECYSYIAVETWWHWADYTRYKIFKKPNYLTWTWIYVYSTCY